MSIKGDIFHNPTKTLPKSDPRVERVDMEQSEIGARKSVISKLTGKNTNSIKHVQEGR